MEKILGVCIVKMAINIQQHVLLWFSGLAVSMVCGYGRAFWSCRSCLGVAKRSWEMWIFLEVMLNGFCSVGT